MRTIEERQGLKIACIEEIAFHKGFIGADAVAHLAEPLLKNQYGQYLMGIVEEAKRARR